jgi:hypothetical protein
MVDRRFFGWEQRSAFLQQRFMQMNVRSVFCGALLFRADVTFRDCGKALHADECTFRDCGAMLLQGGWSVPRVRSAISRECGALRGVGGGERRLQAVSLQHEVRHHDKGGLGNLKGVG